MIATGDPTKDLFAAISAHSSHGDYLNPDRDEAALARMRAALAAGADWRARLGPGERDAAFAAATQGSRGPLLVLLDHGVPLDHANDPGDGMLIHRAAAFANIDAVRMLVERGVAPDVRDGNGATPLAHARAWKHGTRAVPVLIGLMRAHGCTPGPALRTDDLRLERVTLADDAPAVLRHVVEAFFVERTGGKAVELLAQLAEQRDVAALLAGLELVRTTSTAKRKTKSLAAAKKARRVDLVHLGDVEADGDLDVACLVATGEVRVRGLVANYEGCVLALGGSLEAEAVWSEGPLAVAGDVRARVAFGVGDNDYQALIRGVLETETLVQLDSHLVEAGEVNVGRTVTSRAAVPDAAFAALRWQKR